MIVVIIYCVILAVPVWLRQEALEAVTLVIKDSHTEKTLEKWTFNIKMEESMLSRTDRQVISKGTAADAFSKTPGGYPCLLGGNKSVIPSSGIFCIRKSQPRDASMQFRSSRDL